MCEWRNKRKRKRDRVEFSMCLDNSFMLYSTTQSVERCVCVCLSHCLHCKRLLFDWHDYGRYFWYVFMPAYFGRLMCTDLSNSPRCNNFVYPYLGLIIYSTLTKTVHQHTDTPNQSHKRICETRVLLYRRGKPYSKHQGVSDSISTE